LIAADEWFSLVPGRARRLRLRTPSGGPATGSVAIEAVNLVGRLSIAVEPRR
jgi:hypothetical protein